MKSLNNYEILETSLLFLLTTYSFQTRKCKGTRSFSNATMMLLGVKKHRNVRSSRMTSTPRLRKSNAQSPRMLQGKSCATINYSDARMIETFEAILFGFMAYISVCR